MPDEKPQRSREELQKALREKIRGGRTNNSGAEQRARAAEAAQQVAFETGDPAVFQAVQGILQNPKKAGAYLAPGRAVGGAPATERDLSDDEEAPPA